MHTNLSEILDGLPPVTARVRLRHDVDRYPHFIARAGEKGTVVMHPEHTTGSVFAVRMDNPLPGAEEWDNEVLWDTDQAHFEKIPFSETVLRDLEVIFPDDLLPVKGPCDYCGRPTKGVVKGGVYHQDGSRCLPGQRLLDPIAGFDPYDPLRVDRWEEET